MHLHALAMRENVKTLKHYWSLFFSEDKYIGLSTDKSREE